MNTNFSGSFHLNDNFNLQSRKLLRALAKSCKTARIEKPDAVAFCGLSGAMIAREFATYLNLNMIACRKRNEKSHGKEVEGPAEVNNYLILDDLITSGRTCQYIIDCVRVFYGTNANCVGIVLTGSAETMWKSGGWNGIPVIALGWAHPSRRIRKTPSCP